MITLTSSGGPPGTPLTEKVGAADLVQVAAWSPAVGCVTIPLTLVSAPPGVTCGKFQSWSQDGSGIWRADPVALVLQLGVGGLGVDGCTGADQVVTSVAVGQAPVEYACGQVFTPWGGASTLLVPAMVPGFGPATAPMLPPERIRYARLVVAIGFSGVQPPPAGTYQIEGG